MPTSSWKQISLVVDIVTRLNPRRVLEVGPGAGKYGVLCREYLGPEAVIHGIEAFPSYVGKLHDAVYDSIFVGDARELLPQQGPDYDLVLMIDVFEHFSREDGALVLAQCARLAPNTLIAVPATWHPQGAYAGNEFEIHRAHYTRRDLRGLGLKQVWRIGDQLVALRSPQTLPLGRQLRSWAISTVAPSFLYDSFVSVRNSLRAGSARLPPPPRSEPRPAATMTGALEHVGNRPRSET